MNLLTTAAAWLADTLAASAGVAVAYTRGATTVPLTAVVANGPQAITQPGAEPVRVPTTDRGYLFRRPDLVAAGLFPPQTGDRVAETLGGVVTTFVAAADTTGPVWEWGEPERATVRVRTVPAK